MSDGNGYPSMERAHVQPLSPLEAADRLGVKAAMLRRHARAYEDTFGHLPRDERGARQYPLEAVQRLQRALTEYHAGRTASVAEALREGMNHTFVDGSGTHGEHGAGQTSLVPEDRVLARLLTEVEALAERFDRNASTSRCEELYAELARREGELRELERRNDALRNELRDARRELEHYRNLSTLQILTRRLFARNDDLFARDDE